MQVPMLPNPTPMPLPPPPSPSPVKPRPPVPMPSPMFALNRSPTALTLSGRSEEHTSELQSPDHLASRLLLEKTTDEPKPYLSRHLAAAPTPIANIAGRIASGPATPNPDDRVCAHGRSPRNNTGLPRRTTTSE